MHQGVKTVLAKADIAQTSKGPIFKVWDQYGTEYATFQQAIWEQARAMLNQPVTVVYDSQPSKDGRFENRYLQSVESDGVPGQMGQTVMPIAPPSNVFAQAQQPMEMPLATTPPVEMVAAGPDYQRPKHPDEQRAIRKAVALQTAVSTLPNLENKLTDPNQVLAIAEVWERWLAE